VSLGTSAQVLDGLVVAQRIREEARMAAGELARRGDPPSLRVILSGNNPASETYVASKTRAARECGCHAETIRLTADTSPGDLLAEVERGSSEQTSRRR